MSETPDEREARQDAELAALEGKTPPADTPADTPAEGPELDADGDPVVPFVVEGTFKAEDLHDAYKLLQAHFMELSRTGNGTLHGVSVARA